MTLRTVSQDRPTLRGARRPKYGGKRAQASPVRVATPGSRLDSGIGAPVGVLTALQTPRIEAPIDGTWATRAIEAIPPRLRSSIYVVSLYVHDWEDDPALPTVRIGFNTEDQVAESAARASDEDEARWNFAFWLRNTRRSNPPGVADEFCGWIDAMYER